jgi:hypothetical protein
MVGSFASYSPVSTQTGGLLWIPVDQWMAATVNVTVAKDGVAAAALYGSDRLALVRRRGVRLVELGGRPHDAKSVGGGYLLAPSGSKGSW